MPKIFISYRRSDTVTIAGRIHDRLIEAFSEENVFKDVDNIPFGADFRTVIADYVKKSDVVLVLIGRNWLAPQTDGTQRLDDPNDVVRFEISLGLSLPHAEVIPVLVEDTSMPSVQSLPEELREISFLNAAPVRNDPDFNRDMNRLIDRLKLIQSQTDLAKKTQPRSWIMIAVTGIITVVVAVMLLLINNLPEDAPLSVQQIAETRQAQTLSAIEASSQTAAFEASVEAIVNANFTATAIAYLPTETDIPSPTIDLSATAAIGETEAAADLETQNALASANAPTNTLEPSDTQAPSPSPTQTEDLSASVTANANMTSTQSDLETRAYNTAIAEQHSYETATEAALQTESSIAQMTATRLTPNYRATSRMNAATALVAPTATPTPNYRATSRMLSATDLVAPTDTPTSYPTSRADVNRTQAARTVVAQTRTAQAVDCFVEAEQRVNLRFSPDGAIAGTMDSSDGQIRVIGYTGSISVSTFRWYKLMNTNWVRSDTISLVGGDCDALPYIENP